MINLSKDTIALLEDIEERIDPDVEDKYQAAAVHPDVVVTRPNTAFLAVRPVRPLIVLRVLRVLRVLQEAVQVTVQEAAARPIVRAVHHPGVVVPIHPRTPAVHPIVEDVQAEEVVVNN
jgi:hypothetical protein